MPQIMFQCLTGEEHWPGSAILWIDANHNTSGSLFIDPQDAFERDGPIQPCVWDLGPLKKEIDRHIHLNTSSVHKCGRESHCHHRQRFGWIQGNKEIHLPLPCSDKVVGNL